MAESDGRHQILIATYSHPRPAMDSGSLCTANFVRMATSLGFAVTHCVPGPRFNAPQDVRDQMRALGARSVGAPEFSSVEEFIKAEGHTFSLVVLSSFAVGGALYGPVRKWCPQARILFNTVDLHHIRYGREAQLSGSTDLKQLSETARKTEIFLASHCEATLVVSAVEEDYLRKLVPAARVIHVPLIRDIPGRGNGFEARANLAFVGNFGHRPNLDAVLVFARKIWPLIHEALPTARFRVIGAGWTDEMPKLEQPGIEIAGHVVDLTAELEQTKVTVAPLRAGAGAKGKVATSLAHGVPCVASRIAAEGMGVTNGVDILIADDPRAFADCVVQVYSDKALWLRLSEGALAHARKHHSLEAGTRLIRGLFEDLGLMRRSEDQASLRP